MSAPDSTNGSRQRGHEAASEPRITLEMSGLSTENYLVPDCSDQSPSEGKLPGGHQTVSVWPLQCARDKQGSRGSSAFAQSLLGEMGGFGSSQS